MTNQAHTVRAVVDDGSLASKPSSPLSGSSLVPMLVAGLVLTLVGMIAALALS